MNKEQINHWNKHEDTFNMYIDMQMTLQPTMDILQPFIKPFIAENPNALSPGCHSCLIDMLIWVRSQLPKEIKTK